MMVSGLDNKLSDVNDKPNSTLLYGNGPGYGGQALCLSGRTCVCSGSCHLSSSLKP
jgi:hypothetical protein